MLKRLQSKTPSEKPHPEKPQFSLSESNRTNTNGSHAHPIPPPSDRRQYRAIGVVRGRYVPASEEEFWRGLIITEDGLEIETLLLGKTLHLIKKKLDLTQPYFWVVYPRTPKAEGGYKLHFHVVGVWAPEQLHQEKTSPPIVDGYFSIRGELLFNSQKQKIVVVKIQRLPRRPNETPRSFNLTLTGTVPKKSPGYLWDFQVQRHGTSLLIQQATTAAILPPRKLKKLKPSRNFKSKKPQKIKK